jgi:hypothetical protein
MSLDVVTPADGATVARSFEVEVRSNVPFGTPSTGRHHLHLYYDGVKSEGDYDIVYDTSATATRLSPGRHTVEAEIANPDHSGTGVFKRFTVTVGTADAAPAPTPDTTAPSSAGNGY